MRTRVGALVVVVGLLAAACGSRTDDQAVVAQGGVPDSTDQAGEPSESTIESPCGEGDASGATDIGVTDDSITIANIADIEVPGVPGLFQQNQEAMEAFVAYCNSLGGVNGRELVLDTLDSKLTEHLQAVEKACKNAFAMVGNGSLFDDAGLPAQLECGIPSVPGITGSPAASGDTTLMVQPLPNPPDSWVKGPGLYVIDEAPNAAENAAMFAAPSAARQQADLQVDIYEQIGFDWVIDDDIGIGESTTDWQPRVKSMKDKGAEYVYVQAEDVDLANFLLEAETQGYAPEWIDAGQQVYTDAFLEAAGSTAEGVHVYVTTVPFEEAGTSEMLQTYLDWIEKTTPGASPDALSVQSWSAGLLFATAAKALGSDLTREGLMDELHSITEWDGLGMHVPTNPGENIGTDCFMYVQVQDGEFVREFPEEGFECIEGNRLPRVEQELK
ncbi:MAG: ABC transporter substrate-binding protein [Acidimicrobiia bacterium]|nr:ABC transporter substrate-binding protein [Acidimicrobiia bacterium]